MKKGRIYSVDSDADLIIFQFDKIDVHTLESFKIALRAIIPERLKNKLLFLANTKFNLYQFKEGKFFNESL